MQISDETIRVLLVEDDPDAVRLFARRLAWSPAARFEVEHAPDLQSALGRIERRSYGGVLLDLALPDGESTSTLAAAAAIARHLPIVILTSNEDTELALLAARVGVQDYLVKRHQDAQSLVRALLSAVYRHGFAKRLSRSAA